MLLCLSWSLLSMLVPYVGYFPMKGLFHFWNLMLIRFNVTILMTSSLFHWQWVSCIFPDSYHTSLVTIFSTVRISNLCYKHDKEEFHILPSVRQAWPCLVGVSKLPAAALTLISSMLAKAALEGKVCPPHRLCGCREWWGHLVIQLTLLYCKMTPSHPQHLCNHGESSGNKPGTEAKQLISPWSNVGWGSVLQGRERDFQSWGEGGGSGL